MTQIQEFDFNVDLLRAILWQYNDAVNLQSILQQKQDWYDINHKDFWDNWYRDVFDLRTANDFGCAVWSTILNIPLGVDVGARDPTGPSWGYGQYHRNYNRGNFIGSSSTFVRLSLDQKRTVLQLRYFQLVSRGTVPEINYFLNRLFGQYGNCYVLDSLDMALSLYIFLFQPSSQLIFIFQYFDLLPRPAGVGVDFRVVSKISFGFGQFHVNFNNGNFV